MNLRSPEVMAHEREEQRAREQIAREFVNGLDGETDRKDVSLEIEEAGGGIGGD